MNLQVLSGLLAPLGLFALGAARGQELPAVPAGSITIPQLLSPPKTTSAPGVQQGPQSIGLQPKRAPQDPAHLERHITALELQIKELSEAVKKLQTELKAATGNWGRWNVNLYTLKRTKAIDVAKVLQALFPEKDGVRLRIAADATLNTVLVRGRRTELDVVGVVISKMEDIAEQGRGKHVQAPGYRAKIAAARASSSGEGTNPRNPFMPPEKVTLGKHAIPTSRWNSGTYAPGWIEVDLGAPQRLDRITLVCCQDIAGPTIHEIWISDVPIGGDRSRLGLLVPGASPALPAPAGEDRSKAKLVHTFRGETGQGQKLTYEFGQAVSARYVQVRTTQSPTWVGWESIDLRVRDEEPARSATPARENAGKQAFANAPFVEGLKQRDGEKK